MIINFEEELLRSRLSVIENLDGLTAVLFEILTFQLKSFLVVFLPLRSPTHPKGVMIINFEEDLLRSRLSVIENLDALNAVRFEILTFQLKSFLVVFLPLRSPTEKELR